MNRRHLLKALGALGLSPALPALPVTALASVSASQGATTATVPLISAQTYQWAEMMVRAHDKCNLTMLERLLQLDSATASELRNRLIRNGVISGAKSAHAMHRALKPLYGELSPRPSLSEALQNNLAREKETFMEGDSTLPEAKPIKAEVEAVQIDSTDEDECHLQLEEVDAACEQAESPLEEPESGFEEDLPCDSNQSKKITPTCG